MRAQYFKVALASVAWFTSCQPVSSQTDTKSVTPVQPAACVGDEFAIRGLNKAEKPECLDVLHFPTVRYFSDPAEYQKIAERYGLNRTLDLIRSQGVKAAQREYALIANLGHADTFWIAQIPVRKKVVRTVFQASEFRISTALALNAIPPGVRKSLEDYATSSPVVAKELEQLKSGHYTGAHGQLRLTFSEPVVLVEQKNVANRSVVSELVLSVHAVSPGSAPGTYDPIKGLTNAYGTALGVYSVSDKIYQAINRHVIDSKEPSLVRQYLLNISPEKVDATVLAYLNKAKSVFENLPYNTAARNCGSEVFEVLDEVLGYDASKDSGLAVLGRQYPKYAQFGLLPRGFISLRQGANPNPLGGFLDEEISQPMPTMNKELGLPEPK